MKLRLAALSTVVCFPCMTYGDQKVDLNSPSPRINGEDFLRAQRHVRAQENHPVLCAITDGSTEDKSHFLPSGLFLSSGFKIDLSLDLEGFIEPVLTAWFELSLVLGVEFIRCIELIADFILQRSSLHLKDGMDP